jgi:hypothetical protein
VQFLLANGRFVCHPEEKLRVEPEIGAEFSNMGAVKFALFEQ